MLINQIISQGNNANVLCTFAMLCFPYFKHECTEEYHIKGDIFSEYPKTLSNVSVRETATSCDSMTSSQIICAMSMRTDHLLVQFCMSL